jgi:signal peptidase I
VLCALLIRSFIAEAYEIPSGSMRPTLEVGDHILVNKFVYGLGWPVAGAKFWLYGGPARGDVVVFRSVENPSENLIKRVVALAGDTVEVKAGGVYVNGEPLSDTAVGSLVYTEVDEANLARRPTRVAIESRENTFGRSHSVYHFADAQAFAGCPPGALWGCGGPYRVPADHVFVMGDNRDDSNDSRFWGPVAVRDIRGRAELVWWSRDPTRMFPAGARLARLGQRIH